MTLTPKQIEEGWHATFSTSNPYCPCDLKSFTKAVRWAETAARADPVAAARTELPQPTADWKAAAKFDPMVNPKRPSYYIGNAADETPAEQVLRKLACWLGVGGYNAPTVDAEVFHEKIVWAVENLFVPKGLAAAPAGEVPEPKKDPDASD